jgi:hypothetical protein
VVQLHLARCMWHACTQVLHRGEERCTYRKEIDLTGARACVSMCAHARVTQDQILGTAQGAPIMCTMHHAQQHSCNKTVANSVELATPSPAAAHDSGDANSTGAWPHVWCGVQGSGKTLPAEAWRNPGVVRVTPEPYGGVPNAWPLSPTDCRNWAVGCCWRAALRGVSHATPSLCAQAHTHTYTRVCGWACKLALQVLQL